ncbi:hypothetical protein A5714_14440 [Mycobacterium sp. E2462]|nr:hypothetical protein A5714_14440 [Mycobacterium sp. E2462]
MSVAALGLCPSAAADPAAPQPTPQTNSTAGLPGLPALSQLSPIIQQAAGAAWVSPGIDGSPPGAAAADVGAAAEGTPGKLMPGVAGGAGGVAPSAVARFCRICGALAAELISCCGMFGTGGAGTGSAWAIPPVSSAADEPTTTAAARM